MSRIGLFVTARANASRLPEKMLLSLGAATTLEFLLRRLEAAVQPQVRVLCTTESGGDDRLAELAKASDWQVFRGDEEDVLARYHGACQAFDIHLFANVDGDDLLCAPTLVDEVLMRAQEKEADFVHCQGLPIGLAPIAVSARALADVVARKCEKDTQGWGRYFLQTGRYDIETLEADPQMARPYRLTLDYPEDLHLFRTIVEEIGPLAYGLGVVEIIALLDAHPEWAALNQGVNERYWSRFQAAHGGFDATPFAVNK